MDPLGIFNDRRNLNTRESSFDTSIRKTAAGAGMEFACPGIVGNERRLKRNPLGRCDDYAIVTSSDASSTTMRVLQLKVTTVVSAHVVRRCSSYFCRIQGSISAVYYLTPAICSRVAVLHMTRSTVNLGTTEVIVITGNYFRLDLYIIVDLHQISRPFPFNDFTVAFP